MTTSLETIADSESAEIVGGIPIVIPILIGIAIGTSNAVVGTVVNNWSAFKQGFAELTI